MAWLLLGIIVLTSGMFIKVKWFNMVVAAGMFAVYFNMLNEPTYNYLIFILGIVLLIIELYVPSYGMIGIVGFVTVVWALFMHIQDINQLILILIYSLIAILGVVFISFKSGRELMISPDMVLTTELNQDAGYVPAKTHSELLGQQAVVVETLRPVGRAKMNTTGEVLEVISNAGMIVVGTSVVIDKVEGSTLYVRPVE